ncbi:MAG TPA: hypothetical protein VFC03_16625 [Acidimicrobiales bacterium]|nr:hypothetical protein [Acidimicrobiales bacterium]
MDQSISTLTVHPERYEVRKTYIPSVVRLPAQIRLAVDFDGANPSEVDDRIAADMFAGSCVSESMVESACCLGRVAA